MRALSDLELALARYCLCLLLVLVDAANYQRGAVVPREGHNPAKALLPIFKINRIDYRLAGCAVKQPDLL